MNLETERTSIVFFNIAKNGRNKSISHIRKTIQHKLLLVQRHYPARRPFEKYWLTQLNSSRVTADQRNVVTHWRWYVQLKIFTARAKHFRKGHNSLSSIYLVAGFKQNQADNSLPSFYCKVLNRSVSVRPFAVYVSIASFYPEERKRVSAHTATT